MASTVMVLNFLNAAFAKPSVLQLSAALCDGPFEAHTDFYGIFICHVTCSCHSPSVFFLVCPQEATLLLWAQDLETHPHPGTAAHNVQLKLNAISFHLLQLLLEATKGQYTTVG